MGTASWELTTRLLYDSPFTILLTLPCNGEIGGTQRAILTVSIFTLEAQLAS